MKSTNRVSATAMYYSTEFSEKTSRVRKFPEFQYSYTRDKQITLYYAQMYTTLWHFLSFTIVFLAQENAHKVLYLKIKVFRLPANPITINSSILNSSLYEPRTYLQNITASKNAVDINLDTMTGYHEK